MGTGQLVTVIPRRELESYVSEVLTRFEHVSGQFYDDWRGRFKKRSDNPQFDNPQVDLTSFMTRCDETGKGLDTRLRNVVNSTLDTLTAHYPSDKESLERTRNSLHEGIPSYVATSSEYFIASARYCNTLVQGGKPLLIGLMGGFAVPPLLAIAHSTFVNKGVPNLSLEYYMTAVSIGLGSALCGYMVAMMYHGGQLKKLAPAMKETCLKRKTLAQKIRAEALHAYTERT